MPWTVLRYESMSASTVWTVQQYYDDGAESREGYGNGDGANESHGHDTSQRGRFPPKPRCHCCCGSASLTEARPSLDEAVDENCARRVGVSTRRLFARCEVRGVERQAATLEALLVGTRHCPQKLAARVWPRARRHLCTERVTSVSGWGIPVRIVGQGSRGSSSLTPCTPDRSGSPRT